MIFSQPTAVAVTLLFFQRCHGLLASSPPASKAYSPLHMGGYDSTTGAHPSTPIQFFCLPENTCPYAARVLITLEELEMSFDTNLVQGKPDWYLRMNPTGLVPALRLPAHDNQVIYESNICCEFLCDYSTSTLKRPQTLMPMNSPLERARIRLLNHYCDNVFTKAQFTLLMNKDETREAELHQEMEQALFVYEKALVDSGGPFLLGQDITLADIHILPFIARLIVTLRHYKQYELDKFPNLLKWFDVCSRRDSVQTAALTEEKMIQIYDKFMEIDYSFGGLNQNN